MRKKIKKEIKGIIQTMSEAHEHVVFLLQNKSIAEANNLLSQCQDCAVHIGESIEKSEGMDTKAVSHLETYCDYLFKMSRTIEKKKLSGLKRQLDSILKQAEYEIDENIPLDRMKIVFMPYKASMWDCMESVWEAADADEECDAYVVPIPYYERNEQGGAEKFCYEGDMFPKEVPITSYETFSLDAERPDVIYIHNPYDENNYVTSVHPDYYTSKLKEYTDELVYIPYFILYPGGMPETHKNLAAYQNIDKIIVQDEDKKESMLDFVPAEKIAALGCPKVDRILKLGRKRDEIIEHEIPEEWQRKIVGKKVILFNVSINGILKNKKYAMDKIRYVLSCFENRDDVVLLWRPHPLIEATLKSMRPELYGEYMGIKKSFVRKGKGIFDETADAGVATVVADAYLGEQTSSLVLYFGVLGKPVMYIDWMVTEDKRKDRGFLAFNSFFQEGNDIFFVPINIGTIAHDLYRMNLESGIIEKVMNFPGLPDGSEASYYGIKRVQNKIVLVPHNAEGIYIYNIETKKGIKIFLPNFASWKGMFDEAVEYKGKLFLLPRCYPAILSLDVENMEICEYKECVEPFLLEEETQQMFHWAYVQKNQYLYLASCNDSRMLIFNMEDGSYQVKEIGSYPYGYYRMIYDGEYFWLAAFKANCIVRWDEQSGDAKEYKYPVEQEPSVEGAYFSVLLDKHDEIIVCYAFSADIVFLNKNTGEYRRRKVIKNILGRIEEHSIENRGGFGYAKLLDQETALLVDTGTFSLHVWNIQTDKWKTFPCRIPKAELIDLEKNLIEKYWISRSTPYSLAEPCVAISQFIDYIVTADLDIFQQSYECYQAERDSTIGSGIHEYIKQ